MKISEFQNVMKERFGEEDRRRGPYFLTVVLTSEVGELADAIKKNNQDGIREELADVMFCVVSLANVFDIDLEKEVVEKYVNQSKEKIREKWPEPVEKWKNNNIMLEKFFSTESRNEV